jgi:hypothetical protein
MQIPCYKLLIIHGIKKLDICFSPLIICFIVRTQQEFNLASSVSDIFTLYV